MRSYAQCLMEIIEIDKPFPPCCTGPMAPAFVHISQFVPLTRLLAGEGRPRRRNPPFPSPSRRPCRDKPPMVLTSLFYPRHPSEGWDPSKARFQAVRLEGFQPSLERRARVSCCFTMISSRHLRRVNPTGDKLDRNYGRQSRASPQSRAQLLLILKAIAPIFLAWNTAAYELER
jgi:hypothetical protein